MLYQIHLWKGLTMPYVGAHQLNKAEEYYGIWRKTIILLFVSLIFSGISSYFGVGNEQLSKLIYEASPSEFEAIKGLFAVGQVLQVLLTTAILIFFPALIFWVFTDTEYRKLVVVQIFVACIFLIEKLIMLPLQIYFGIDNASSPFALGVIAQYLTDYELVSNFLGEISLFSIWSLIVQYKYLGVITDKNKRFLLFLILTINLFLWVASAFFSYIKFEVFF